MEAEGGVEVGGADVTLELVDGGEGGAVLEPADDVEGRDGEDIGVVIARPDIYIYIYRFWPILTIL